MKSLFYSLNAAIWMHALPESRLARELTARGHETIYVSCGSVFRTHCTSMGAHGLDLSSDRRRKDSICALCAENASILAKANSARHLQLADHIDEESRAEIARILTTVTQDNYLELSALGVDIGRAAVYELFLRYKKMSERLGPEEWQYYLVYIENALLSLFGFARIFERERPEAVFFYSPQYGVNGACASYAAARGARVYFVEGSSSNSERYRALRIWDWQAYGLVNPAVSNWHATRSQISAEDIARVGGHFDELFKAKSFAVYSAPIRRDVSIRQYFKVPAAAKVILLTLSSYDEAYAALVIGKFPRRKVESPVFKDQFEWVRHTVATMAARPDVFLIIRVHPRDFPNKREGQRSEQSFLWEDIFKSLPKNVAVNWPKDGISLYNFLREVDVVTTGWSATGIEALSLGIPVVTYDNALPSYPADIHFTGESVEGYERNLDRALASGRQFNLAAAALRWLAASFSVGTVRITGPVILEKWLRVFVLRRLRAVAYAMLNGPVKRIESRRRFGPRSEADRFVEFVTTGRSSLFAVIDKTGDRSEIAVDRQLFRMHQALARAIGVPSLSRRAQPEGVEEPALGGR